MYFIWEIKQWQHCLMCKGCCSEPVYGLDGFICVIMFRVNSYCEDTCTPGGAWAFKVEDHS